MTNQNKHLKAFLKMCIQTFFPMVTKSLSFLFPQYSRAILWSRFSLKSMVKKWALNKNLRTHNKLCTPQFVRYIQLNAQVCNISNNTVPWIITDTILKPSEPSPGIGIGSHIKLTDSQRFKVEGFSRRKKGRLEKICGYEQGYVQFILKAHIIGREDIYGSHLPKSTVAIPIQFLHLSPIHHIYCNLAFSLLGWTMGQTIDNDTIYPLCWSFALFEEKEVEVVQRVGQASTEQRLREVEKMEGIIECIERENNWVE